MYPLRYTEETKFFFGSGISDFHIHKEKNTRNFSDSKNYQVRFD